MGLQCAKQGHIPEFPDGSLKKRFGPEGESFPIDLSKNSHDRLLSTSVTADNVASLLNDICRYSTTSYSPQSLFPKERILIGEEENQMSKLQHSDKGNQVYLPPEGEATINSDYVELPKEKELQRDDEHVSLKDCYVELPPSSDHKTFEENNTQTDSGSSVEVSHEFKSSSEAASDENQWSYTLYNFEGNGISTKKDLYDIMTSICNVVGKTVYKDSTSNTSDQSLRVQLEFTQSNGVRKTPVKSPSKYAPSKYYKGMIFPPPNSKEAEKVSVYLEEKLSHFKEESSRTKHFHDRQQCHRCSRSENSAKEKYKPQKKDDEKHCHIPKRKNVFIGDDYKVDKKRNDRLRNIQNGENLGHTNSITPGEHSSDKIKFSLKCDAENNETRLKHSCKYHTQLKEAMNLQPCRNNLGQESTRCRQIKLDSKHHIAYYDNDSLSLSSYGSTQSSGNNSQKSCSQNKIPNLSRGCSDQRRKAYTNDRVESPLTPSRTRPAVWPGECIETKEKSSVQTTTRLCICKRMCGLNYPCNHTSITHTHNHQHHYYLPKSEKT